MIELLRNIEASRGVPIDTLCAALEEALQVAYREHAGDVDALATVDRRTATLALHRRRRVVDELADPLREIARAAAPAGYEVGDFLDEQIDVDAFRSSTGFGRVAALTASRVIAQRVLEHERESVYARYRPLQGTIVSGLVQRELHGSLYVVFEDGQEAVLPRSERAPRDAFAINDMLEAELFGVYRTTRGPALLLSRSRASFVRALLHATSDILAAARRPGFVTYLALRPGLSAPLSSEIARLSAHVGERIEIIRWSHDPAEMVAQLLPLGTGEVFALEEHRIVFVESADVTPLQLELATQLCGWPVIRTEPGKSDVGLEAHLTAIAAAAPVASDVAIDPALVRRLEEFARERELSEGDEDVLL